MVETQMVKPTFYMKSEDNKNINARLRKVDGWSVREAPVACTVPLSVAVPPPLPLIVVLGAEPEAEDGPVSWPDALSVALGDCSEDNDTELLSSPDVLDLALGAETEAEDEPVSSPDVLDVALDGCSEKEDNTVGVACVCDAPSGLEVSGTGMIDPVLVEGSTTD